MGGKSSTEVKRTVSSDLGMSPKISAALKRLDSKSAIPPRRARSHNSLTEMSEDPWGWFEDFENPNLHQKTIAAGTAECKLQQHLQRALSLPAPATSPPIYVLESSIATQHLWYETAGRRPKQPEHEREYFERLWLKNFESSSVQYVDNIAAAQSKSRYDKIPPTEFDGEILIRGKGPFSNSVSKSFEGHEISSLTLQVITTFIIRVAGEGKFNS